MITLIPSFADYKVSPWRWTLIFDRLLSVMYLPFCNIITASLASVQSIASLFLFSSLLSSCQNFSPALATAHGRSLASSSEPITWDFCEWAKEYLRMMVFVHHVMCLVTEISGHICRRATCRYENHSSREKSDAAIYELACYGTMKRLTNGKPQQEHEPRDFDFRID